MQAGLESSEVSSNLSYSCGVGVASSGMGSTLHFSLSRSLLFVRLLSENGPTGIEPATFGAPSRWSRFKGRSK
jgi:hypothetical protein